MGRASIYSATIENSDRKRKFKVKLSGAALVGLQCTSPRISKFCAKCVAAKVPTCMPEKMLQRPPHQPHLFPIQGEILDIFG